ncbi:type II toxin-antitoxin system VapC family toxin [Mangrovibrevibacter kandeliae]|uniref:type II toxin-antitoxin system VapC family toxin n=1 Tax=Mangrovibrevibacter kandeliae TaxID=2968473 RepID=UPI002118F141|nr:MULTISPECIES: type II toxin-antitoxin system VapC family toxin [unclassified Aurantimonas]MCQ8782363.1 type II toxin-antitoxin system VapC family toxin [Aurantimonas sp. CSK15Z-1]MCW4114990.1 type II toxin-antitoxin system VapC family toxin [Aurantimonas sp. MSK8Z-1]
MFVDGSVLMAMLTDEDEARIFAARLQTSNKRFASPIAVYEAVAAVSRDLGLAVAEAEEAVRRFLDLMTIQVVSMPPQVAGLALDAYARFGRGRGASGGLNTGDCFTYACARYYRQPLLYKGPKFAATDIEAA